MVRHDPFPEFVELLVTHSTAIFQKVKDQYPDEHFYGFGFRTSVYYNYLVAAGNTEEGLWRYARENACYFPGQTLGQIVRTMRWQSMAWLEAQYWFDRDDQFAAITTWHQQHVPDYHAIPWATDEEVFNQVDTWWSRMDASLEAALPLIGEQLFPHGNPQVHIDAEGEVYLYAVGIDTEQ
ncbi:MAG: hypothetical protein NZ821_02025 [Gloeomargarita sp. SKYB31]|nr:hypothetical protein [Gloeomargarita sp. SKYB31]